MAVKAGGSACRSPDSQAPDLSALESYSEGSGGAARESDEDRVTINPEALSRVASRALRHAPEEYGLKLDPQGWVLVDALVAALRAGRKGWEAVTRADVERMMATASKQRFEIDGDRIRAMYGHSVTAEIQHVEAAPPSILFHGTTPAAWESIRADGLRPMNRQRVHLAADVATAVIVGIRRANPPVVLEVRAAEAAAAGVRFWIGNDSIWLADFVPVAYLRVTSER